MNKKVFVTRKIPDIGISMLRDRGYEVSVYPKDRVPSQREIIKILRKGEFDAVLSLLTDKVDARVFDAAPSVKIVANYATGFDNVDIVEAKKRGVVVTNAPAPQTAESVAEHTIALMLALAARIVEADEFVRRKKYKGWAPMNFVGVDILGKTLGLIGAGRIGERVAYYAKGLGMNVIYSDIARNEKIEKECAAAYYPTHEDVLKNADIVSLHVPLMDATRHLINAERLALMKSTAFLVNTSRGAVIDEAALEKALKNNVIAGAGLDVFEFEPEVSGGLRKLQNVILTPHIASASIETRNQMAEITARNIIDFFEGRVVQNQVNK
ncbi:MAG TPA: D-glycerate dehydrogenase [Candidatus Nanoarchaeia archaeon]|nr:D-glycerate dehydrogenase [Candidatus Nanoarchaeia archaeon]